MTRHDVLLHNLASDIFATSNNDGDTRVQECSSLVPQVSHTIHQGPETLSFVVIIQNHGKSGTGFLIHDFYQGREKFLANDIFIGWYMQEEV